MFYYKDHDFSDYMFSVFSKIRSDHMFFHPVGLHGGSLVDTKTANISQTTHTPRKIIRGDGRTCVC